MSTQYENLGPIYTTAEKFNALKTAGTLEVGREYKIVDWEAQEKISDLATIRSGAALGATSLQSADKVELATYIANKVDKPDEPVEGQGVNVPYYFSVDYEADKAVVKDYTIDLINKAKTPQVFSLDINAATTEKAGLMKAADKVKLEATAADADVVKVTGDQDINGSKTFKSPIIYSDGLNYTKLDQKKIVIGGAMMDATTFNLPDDLMPGDTATLATQAWTEDKISGKQDTLTAGTNIDITDNVISATGSVPTNMLTTDTAQTVSGVKSFSAPILFTPQSDTFIKLSASADNSSDTLKLISGNTTGTTAGSTELDIFYNYDTGSKAVIPATDSDVELGRTDRRFKQLFVSGALRDGDQTGSNAITVAQIVAKQDKLTAGDNITIDENNVISATVTGSAWTACPLTTTEPEGYPYLPSDGTYEILYKDGNIRYTFGTLFYDTSYPNCYGSMIKKAGEAIYLQLKCASGREVQIYPITATTGAEGEMIDLHESGKTESTKIFYRKLL